MLEDSDALVESPSVSRRCVLMALIAATQVAANVANKALAQAHRSS